jgi:hypothetical protein
MRARLCDPGSLKQALSFWTCWQLASPLFELVGLFGHSLFKGTGLFYSITGLRHGSSPGD